MKASPRAGATSPDAAPAPPDAAVPQGLGRSLAEAIEVCEPAGEVSYLSRLRCADGSAPSFERTGTAGFRSPPRDEADQERALDQVTTRRRLEAGESDLHPIDRYRVVCAGAPEQALYLDMYHCDETQDAAAPAGFSLAEPKREERTTAEP